MNIDNSKSFLQLKVIWKDDDMFELRVTVSNGRYFGSTEVYDFSESLKNFSESLEGFPKNKTILFYEAGNKETSGYFSMKFYSVGHSGRIGVEISIEENVSTYQRQEEKSRLKLEIIVQPGTIDNFQRELLELAKIEEGLALLQGSND